VICVARQSDFGFPSASIGSGRRAHLIGAGGAGMRSLAEVLARDGWQLTGSDAAAGSGSTWNRRVTPGGGIDRSLDLVIHSDAVPADDRQRDQAAALGVPTISYPVALGRLVAQRRGLAVAGTHGKSTTAAMLARILGAAGADPSFVFGAEYQDASPGGGRGQGEWMIAEACEYRENFRHLRPEMAVLLGIEADHFDYYHSWAQLEGAFTRLVAALPSEGRLLLAADCARARRVARAAACPCETFGLGIASEADWQADVERVVAGRHSFAVRRGGRMLGRIELAVPGRHNVVNALAAIAAAHHAGASWQGIRQGLVTFCGLRRRLETVADRSGMAVIDDYAHLPTEIAASLAAVRQMYPGRRLWCVFQPHQASRTAHLLDELATSLQNADNLVVAEIFRAREGVARPGEVRAADLARRAAGLGAAVVDAHAVDEIRSILERSLKAGDVVVTLGAGDIGNLAHGIAQGI
jgi:UDP-N-acetylmuramate--alanine ligase